GRLDAQVKVRGFRIELGEIESALLETPGVIRAAAAAREGATGDAQLVGYVVPDAALGSGAEARDTSEIVEAALSRLRDKLPSYMIPQQLMVLEELPLTPNGKTDRKALPAPEADRAEVHTPPSTPTEVALVGIWADVLHQDGIGVHDNFFALGGHSLLATQVIARIR
ncbi:AMP-binding enzyme, partial [Streptomyces daliensis]